MKKIKVVQLGITHPHASGIFKCIKQLPDVFDIAGVCEPSEQHQKGLCSDLYKDTPHLSVDDILKQTVHMDIVVEEEPEDE